MLEPARQTTEYEARRAAVVHRLRSEAGSPVALVRDVARIVRWLTQPQPAEALGSSRGIVSDDAYQLVIDTYTMVTLPHSATGKPSFQIEPVGGRTSTGVPDQDRRLFMHVVDRVSRGRVLADWEDDLRYCLAVDVPVHPSLVRAVTSNRGKFSRCDDLTHHTALFVVPSGWHD